MVRATNPRPRQFFQSKLRCGQTLMFRIPTKRDQQTTLQVVLADEQLLFRQGLRLLLEESECIHIIGEASDGQNAVRLVLERQPQVLIVGLAMPQLDGLAVIRNLRARGCGTKVVVVSMFSDANVVRECFQSGANGYVPKTASLEDVCDALRMVISGRRYLSSQIGCCTLEGMDSVSPLMSLPNAECLTPREREILGLVAEGYTNQSIAEILGISPRTVDTHRTHLMSKLGIHDAVGLTRFAIAHDLTILPERLLRTD